MSYIILFVSIILSCASCSSKVGFYTDTRIEDSTALAQAQKQAPIFKPLKGEEAKRYADSLLSALMLHSNIDSATLFSIPTGYARMLDSGTSYLRKLTPEEVEANERLFASLNNGDAYGDILAYSLNGELVGKAGYRERGKSYVINTGGLPTGTYMLSIPGENKRKRIVVQ